MVSFSSFCSFSDNSVLFRYCLVKRPFCTFLLVSLIKNFLSFLFYFLPFFGWEFSFFSFCFLPLFDWEFPFFSFWLSLWLEIFLFFFFASEGKDYGESGFWLKACRMARHDTCQGLVWFKDKKGCPTLFPWHKCKNDDLETLCKTGHACTYADTQVSNFYGHVMLGLRIHFLYFKSTQCFQNMFFYQFVHSSESILGTRENFTAFTLQVYTHFFSKN